MINKNFEVIILGAGMVGLSIAHQLKERGISEDILIIEKEREVGKHSSGRNSGVLHAGLYYPPGSLKAKVCVSGSKRLKKWIKENELQINNCGKVIIPQKEHLDSQLDLLAERGKANGAEIEFLSNTILKEKFPQLNSVSGRALWSPNTSVVNPLEILMKLKNNLLESGVNISTSENNYRVNFETKTIRKNNGENIEFKYLFNCAGMNATEISQDCFQDMGYKVIPFKGMYWKLEGCDLSNFNTNIYPVPDLNMPFLGVHFTPSFMNKSNTVNEVFIGPTAILAFGKENYYGLENFQFKEFLDNSTKLANLFINDLGGIRKYVKEQLFLSLRPLLLKAVKELVPTVKNFNIVKSKKVGIRSQLFDMKAKKLVDDFICINSDNATHVLNAVSPAFTASFALADLIIDKSELSKDSFNKESFL